VRPVLFGGKNGFASRVAEVKARLLAASTDVRTAAFIPRLSRKWLSTAEIKYVVDHGLTRDTRGARNMRALLGTMFCGNRELISHIEGRLEPGAGSIEHRIGWRLLLARLRDMRRLSTASLGGIDWSDFRKEADSAAADIRSLMTDTLVSGAMSQAPAELQAACWIHSADCYFDAASFAVWLIDRIRRREPTSVIRLDRTRLRSLAAGSGPQQEESVAALRRADAIGLPWADWSVPPRGESAGVRKNAGCSSATAAFVDTLLREPCRARAIVSCEIDSDLDRWDLYRQVFAGVSSVSVIGPRDPSRFLAEQLGIAVRRWYRTSAGPSGSSIIRNGGIQADPGEVFLVCGNSGNIQICDLVRARGGIALDCGTIVPYWFHFNSRIYARFWSGLDVANAPVEGQPFVDEAGLRGITNQEPCRSDFCRRVNLAEKFDHLFEPPRESSRARRILVTGHPRCGSAYVTEVFVRLGVRLGHERPQRDGVCSWAYAVSDLTPVFQEPRLARDLFGLTLSHVRDPRAAIPSIMLENTNAQSLGFRRFHIFRALGIDIMRRRDPVERAAESYLCWMRIVEQLNPGFALRIEHIFDDLLKHEDVLRRAGLAFGPDRMARARAVAPDVNASGKKFWLPKPVLAPGHYRDIAPDLRDALAGFCETYGYRLDV
jgi:hypothetical protein